MSNESSQDSPIADTGGRRDEAPHRLANGYVVRVDTIFLSQVLTLAIFQGTPTTN